MSDRQKIVIALAASVFVHLVLFVTIGLSGLFVGGASDSKPLEKLKLVSVTVATPTPKPIPILPAQTQPPAPPLIDSDDLHKTNKAPKNPVFQSDKNLVAGSKQPASGNVPLPSQEGKNRDELAFSTHRYVLGNGDGSTAAPPVMQFAPAPELPQKPRTESTPAPQVRPTPPPAPTPEPTVAPTPAKTEEKIAAVTPPPKVVAEPIFRPTPVPAATVAPTPDMIRPTPVPEQQVAMLTTPKPKPPVESVKPQQPAFVPDTQQNQIGGSISNRDQAGVDAVETPKGRYEKRISDAIRARWLYFVDQRRDMITSGRVCVRFYINQKGEVQDLRIISNEANEASAGCSLDAINKAKFQPPPPELAPFLENGLYEEDFSFTIYPYQ